MLSSCMGLFADIKHPDVPEPPPPEHLIYLPVQVGDHTLQALLDSGASDSFISLQNTQRLGLPTYPLSVKLEVSIANVDKIIVSRLTRVIAVIGSMKVKLFLRVISSSLDLVLGYPFLLKFDTKIDWKKRTIFITMKNQTHAIQGIPAPTAARIVVRRRILPTEESNISPDALDAATTAEKFQSFS